MTLIKRRARATLVRKGDVGGDSPSLARVGMRGLRVPIDQSFEVL